MSTNIRRDVTDKFYRYKMPKLISKIEGKGNGIKTLIPNMSDIAKALSRPPAYPTKYLGFELGAQVKMDEKNDRYIVSGAHDAEKLASVLDGFIDKFVLCASCLNPETEFSFHKDGNVLKDCKACGAHLPVDMRHKLYKRQTDRAAAADNSGDDELEHTLEDDLAALPTSNNYDDDNDWAADTSVSAVAARVKDLAVSGAVSKLMDDDNTPDPVEVFANYITNSQIDLTDDDIIAKAGELGVRDDKVIAILAQILLDGKVICDDQIKTRAQLFRSFLKGEKCQKGLLGGIERLVAMSHPELLKDVALIFKALYFNDLVEEGVFLAWSDKISKRYVDKKDAKAIRESAAPFINWLKEADSGSEEEEDSE